MINCMNTLRKKARIVYNINYNDTVDDFCSGKKIDPNNKFNTLLLEGRDILELLGFSDKLADYGDKVKNDVIGAIKQTKRAASKGKSKE